MQILSTVNGSTIDGASIGGPDPLLSEGSNHLAFSLLYLDKSVIREV